MKVKRIELGGGVPCFWKCPHYVINLLTVQSLGSHPICSPHSLAWGGQLTQEIPRRK